MKKKVMLYIFLMIISLILFIVSMTVLGNTEIIAPVIIVISLYLFVGSLIKLCKMNEKFKNTILGSLDLLFFIP